MAYQHICPITQDLMDFPVLADDNQLYEKEMIQRWLETNSRSPLTNQIISDRLIDFSRVTSRLLSSLSDDSLRQIIEEFRANDIEYTQPGTPQNQPESYFDFSLINDSFESPQERQPQSFIGFYYQEAPIYPPFLTVESSSVSLTLVSDSTDSQASESGYNRLVIDII